MWRAMIALAMLTSACSGESTATTTGAEPASSSTASSLTPPTTTTISVTTATEATTAASEATTPNLVLGGITTLQTEFADGTPLFFSIVVPEDFDRAKQCPVFVAMPPGGQDAGLTHNTTEGWYMGEAVARGWVVVSPAAPNGVLWFQGSEVYIEEFLDGVLSWLQPEGGVYHLGGVSNGGRSSFRVLAQIPDRIASVTVYPGYALPEDMPGLEAAGDIPFTLWVGGDDAPWIDPMEQTRDTLVELGKRVTYEVIPGAPHVIPELTDGVKIFDVLDAARP